MASLISRIKTGTSVFSLLALSGVLAACSSNGEPPASHSTNALTGVNVLTRAYNNQRTGVNASETALTQANVNASSFGKLFQVPVDDEVYAGLLYVSALPIAGGVHNVFYVATVNNSVYAFDADAGGVPLWFRNFNGTGRPSRNSELGQFCGTYHDFDENIGIVGTPVIDGTAQTMYFVTRTVEGTATVQRLHALDIKTGSERANSPRVITATAPGTGVTSSGGVITFDPVLGNQRPGLAFANGAVYIAWSSFCDTGTYHGWVMSYDATTLTQTAAFNDTPNGSQGGIWLGGAAPAVDDAGNVYFSLGNGTFDGTADYGESLVKLAPNTLKVLDYFAPSNFGALNDEDQDFGSSGPVLLPGIGKILSGSKEGKAYVVNTANLGHLGDNNASQVFQGVDPTVRPNNTHNIHNSCVAWNAPAGLQVFVWGENDFLRAYRYNGTTFNTPAFAVGSVLPPVGMPGGMMTLSTNANQPGTGILWGTTPLLGDANQNVVPGIMYAFNAETLALLWQSSSAADSIMDFAKFNAPVVANGKVYVPSFSNAVSVFGLGTPPPPPTNLALNKPATGSTPCSSSETPAKAFNGSASGGTSDKFCSHDSPAFLQVDLGAVYNLGEFIVKHAGAGGESSTNDTRDFNIQVSTDGSNFTTVVTVTGNTRDLTSHVINATSGRYVRLNVTTPTSSGDPGTRIYEFEVYAAAGGDSGGGGTGTGGSGGVLGTTNIALNKAATGSTACAANETPNKAVNGALSDKFCSLQTASFLQVDLGASFDIGRFIVKHAGAGGENPGNDTRNYNIQVSQDGANFTTVVTVNNNTSNVTTHDISGTSGRYVRMNIVTPTSTGDAATRIYEFEVYAFTGDGGGGSPTGSGGTSGTSGTGGASGTAGNGGTGGTLGNGGGGAGGASGTSGNGGSGGAGTTNTTNLALRKTATGSTPCSATETPDRAVNGVLSDKFCSLVSGSQLQVDLGSTFGIGKFVIKHAGAGGENPGNDTRNFNIQVSTDGSNFTTALTVTGNTSNVSTHLIPLTNARYVRLNVTTPTSTGDPATRIYEFEVY